MPDTIFEVYRDQFSYTRGDIDPRTEAKDEDPPDWVREKVSFSAAYGNERVLAVLFLPKKAPPPYQVIVFFPGNPPNIYTDTSDDLQYVSVLDFIVKSGRAVAYPIYYGTYERNAVGANGGMCVPTSPYRDICTELTIKWGRDLSRTIDYLEGRDDMDSSRLAFFGLSWGAALGPVMTAIEPRLKTSVLYLGGFWQRSAARPEALALNYAPHVRIPTLMLNGRYDLTFPLQTSVQPMFDRLGTPPEHKRLKLYDTDHYIPRKDLIKETLAWFDKYLGPVALKPAR